MGFKLSPSSLNLLEECPRCFWLHMVKKIKRPRGMFSSLPVKMDSIIKHYFNKYRNLGKLPPIIDGKVNGWLAVGMPKTLKYDMNNGITIWGRPDEYLKLKDNNIVALDHKTKSKAPETVHSSFQLQLDTYSFLLQKMSYETTNKSYLAFYYPDECELHQGMPFNCTVIEIQTDTSRINKVIDKAYNVLNGKIPEAHNNCEYCKWNQEIIKY